MWAGSQGDGWRVCGYAVEKITDLLTNYHCSLRWPYDIGSERDLRPRFELHALNAALRICIRRASRRARGRGGDRRRVMDNADRGYVVEWMIGWERTSDERRREEERNAEFHTAVSHILLDHHSASAHAHTYIHSSESSTLITWLIPSSPPFCRLPSAVTPLCLHNGSYRADCARWNVGLHAKL